MILDNIKSVIFDLDGTLIDSMYIWAEIDELFLKENNVKKPEGFSEAVKRMTLTESARYFNNYIEPPLEETFIRNRIYQLGEHYYKDIITLKDDAGELIDRLVSKNIPYCIVTATEKYLAQIALARFGFGKKSKFLLTPMDISETASKRTPEIFLKACEMLGTSPSETLVVEDSLHCIKAAKAAGCVTVGIADDFSKDDWQEIKETADYNILTLKELT
jgi:HAD superfamily hydrolase (TIGR01509 family)